MFLLRNISSLWLRRTNGPQQTGEIEFVTAMLRSTLHSSGCKTYFTLWSQFLSDCCHFRIIIEYLWFFVKNCTFDGGFLQVLGNHRLFRMLTFFSLSFFFFFASFLHSIDTTLRSSSLPMLFSKNPGGNFYLYVCLNIFLLLSKIYEELFESTVIKCKT